MFTALLLLVGFLKSDLHSNPPEPPVKNSAYLELVVEAPKHADYKMFLVGIGDEVGEIFGAGRAQRRHEVVELFCECHSFFEHERALLRSLSFDL